MISFPYLKLYIFSDGFIFGFQAVPSKRKNIWDKLFLQSFVYRWFDYSDTLTLTAHPVINDVKVTYFKRELPSYFTQKFGIVKHRICSVIYKLPKTKKIQTNTQTMVFKALQGRCKLWFTICFYVRLTFFEYLLNKYWRTRDDVSLAEMISGNLNYDSKNGIILLFCL